MRTDDRRLIEDYLPIAEVSAAASSEPRVKGHISTLHLWRARRPLVACRAAIYGALVPADRWVQQVEIKGEVKDPAKAEADRKKGLNRRQAKAFISRLATYPGEASVIAEAQKHIREACADRPKVLDMFAGGGAIPLEAARLGCEAHALDLNPVAHLIELCSATFPQAFGIGLADDVEKWAKLVLSRVQESVADLYSAPVRGRRSDDTGNLFGMGEESRKLSIVAHLWTRTIPCQNPQCRGTVPLYRQTWLRRKASGYVALRPLVEGKKKVVRFEKVEAASEAALDFDPGDGSERSATTCPFCHSAVPGEYVRSYGDEKGFGQQLMCVVALNPDGSGKLYITDETLAKGEAQRQEMAEKRASGLEKELGQSSLDEVIPPTGNAGLATGRSYLYGIRTFRQMFTPRQRYVLLSMAREIRRAHEEMLKEKMESERAKAITTYLGLWLSRLTDRFNTLARWDNSRENIQGLTSMKRFAMMWDYPELNLFGGASGDAEGALDYITSVIRREGANRNPATCVRGSATELPYPDGHFDAVITDPPYYDNESYAELSDVCYVWLRPALGFLYPEHFAGELTPKKKECVAAAYRQGGKKAARQFYEECLLRALKEAHRVSKKNGILVMVYAHKTTAGWSTLIEAIRSAGFEVAEAWPVDTESKARVAHQDDAALSSSIFIVARKRAEIERKGRYEDQVRPDLEAIVRERVETLWDHGITGADLVIASVGAGLRAFTRYAKVEYANGEEVPAERFLAEVEAVVLDTILARLSKAIGGNGGRHSLAGVDPATRFYILWRYAYGTADLDAGEAIVFANGTGVELDGAKSITHGARALAQKKKAKYGLLDYTQRGEEEKLGLPDDGNPAPLIDALHRTLWLMERRPALLPEFLRDARPNVELMRLVTQALGGHGLKGGEGDVDSPTGEKAALAKLAANWKSVVEDAVSVAPTERKDRRKGQDVFDYEKGGRR